MTAKKKRQVVCPPLSKLPDPMPANVPGLLPEVRFNRLPGDLLQQGRRLILLGALKICQAFDDLGLEIPYVRVFLRGEIQQLAQGDPLANLIQVMKVLASGATEQRIQLHQGNVGHAGQLDCLDLHQRLDQIVPVAVETDADTLRQEDQLPQAESASAGA